MKKGEITQKHGFTIIEVVLVLAIAGLIFLMTFLALPALNRTQRDARRRDDISNLLRKIKEYQSNNRGALPDGDEGNVIWNETGGPARSWTQFYHDYLGDSFSDPSGGGYVLSIASCGQATLGVTCLNIITDSTPFPNDNKVMIFRSASCDGGEAEQSSNPRKIAVQYRLEGGGVYCANT